MNDDIFAPAEHIESAEDCYFYHVMEIPGHGLVGGDWDLRAGVDDYLGHVELTGKRVLEIGPATGFLTFEMESRGAELVSVELGPESTWDIVPHALIDLDAVNADRQKIMVKVRNGYWFAHERFGSRARVFNGSARSLPDELGQFDIAVLGSVLLHNRDPLSMIEQCARLADCIVIAERHFPDLDGQPVAQLYPTAESPQWDTWWNFSPDLFVQFLAILGFDRTEVTFHEQTHVHPGGEIKMPMFTVVGNRA